MVTQFFLLPLLITLVSFLILLWSGLLCLSCMFLTHSWSSSHMPCSWFWNGSHYLHIFCTLQTWLVQFDVLLSSSNAVWSNIITQLLSFIVLWSWMLTACWCFSWHLTFSSLKAYLSQSHSIHTYLSCPQADLLEFYHTLFWQSLVA